MSAMSAAAWFPDTEADEDELCRRAQAALAEVGLFIPVAFVNGFIWGAHHARHHEQIERACELAWLSMARRRSGSEAQA